MNSLGWADRMVSNAKGWKIWAAENFKEQKMAPGGSDDVTLSQGWSTEVDPERGRLWHSRGPSYPDSQ